MQHIKQILTKLKKVNLKLKLEKCEFAKYEIKVFSYWINAEDIRLDLNKVEVI